MILLIIDENPDIVSAILATLKKGGGAHEVHTASCFATARKAADKMAQLDVLISTAITSEGDDAFELRDQMWERFPRLHTAFVNEYDLSGWTSQIGDDPVFDKPPAPDALLSWACTIGLSTHHADSQPLINEVPSTTFESGDDDDLPMAETLSAPGKRLGDYELSRLISGEGECETHEATQLSIDRRVALVLLKPEAAARNESIREFRGLVRARAKVSHPNIAPVYEAFEEAGALFYTRELIEGKNLPALADEGQTIDDTTLVAMVKSIAESLAYLEANAILHDPLRTRHIYLGADGHTRIANIAVLEPEEATTTEEHIRYLGAKLQPLVAPGGSGVSEVLLAKMRDLDGPGAWDEVLTTIGESEDDIASSATYNVATNLRGRRTAARWWTIGAVAAAGVAAWIFVATLPKVTPPKPRELEDMVRIAGGEFPYQDGETATLPTFWIDKQEVTIADYSEFLDALGLPHTDRYDHSDQPVEKMGHQPDAWEEYFDAALRGSRYEGQPIDLNCPVVFVDWWDAYAYANWKGRRLPTEEEWEKAGRSKAGLRYPWGDENDVSKLVSLEPTYGSWRPVDSVPGDISTDGVACMAGNVSEWTGSWEEHPELFGIQVPVLRGGSFRSDAENLPDLTVRKTVNDPGVVADDIGFRTVSDTDPALANEIAP